MANPTAPEEIMPDKPVEETRLTAALPTATVEMVMREHQDAGSEVVTISIRATPSFKALGETFRPEALMWANPFAAWIQMGQMGMRMATLAWQPWLQLAGTAPRRELPKPGAPTP
jgi:hypothetical protein